jgi:hypothetical protein
MLNAIRSAVGVWSPDWAGCCRTSFPSRRPLGRADWPVRGSPAPDQDQTGFTRRERSAGALPEFEYRAQPGYLEDLPYPALRGAEDDGAAFRERAADPDKGMQPRGIHETDLCHVDHEPQRVPADHLGHAVGKDGPAYW